MHIDQYINDGQDPMAVEKLLLKLQDMLAPTGEEITYIAVQKKPAINLFPNSIALTNKRIFFCSLTKLGLATDFNIVPWQAIENLSFKEGVLGSSIIFTKLDGERLVMTYIPRSQVRKLYQAGMEALLAQRAMDGPDGIDASGQRAAAGPTDELTLKLVKLKTLFERELITEAEYENKKSELLSQL